MRNLLQDPDQNLSYALDQNRYRDHNLVQNPFESPFENLMTTPMTASIS